MHQLRPDPTLLDAANLILLSNLPRPCTLINHSRNTTRYLYTCGKKVQIQLIFGKSTFLAVSIVKMVIRNIVFRHLHRTYQYIHFKILWTLFHFSSPIPISTCTGKQTISIKILHMQDNQYNSIS